MKLRANRQVLTLDRGGALERWEYDVIAIKLLCEQLDRRHAIIYANGVAALTEDYMTELASGLRERGLRDCTLDVALQVYHLIAAQFAVLVGDTDKLVREALEDGSRT